MSDKQTIPYDINDDFAELKEIFLNIADKDGSISEKTFMLLLESNKIPTRATQQLFNRIDTDCSGAVDYVELLAAMKDICHQDWETQARFVFDLYDSGTNFLLYVFPVVLM